jgi:hypothetical protein
MSKPPLTPEEAKRLDSVKLFGYTNSAGNDPTPKSTIAPGSLSVAEVTNSVNELLKKYGLKKGGRSKKSRSRRSKRRRSSKRRSTRRRRR